MTSPEVFVEVGGNWKDRPYPADDGLRFFEASGIPAQLVLDKGDVVVEVRPWPFISAGP